MLNYKPVFKRPVKGIYRKRFLISTSNAPSAGPSLIGMFNILEHFKIKRQTPRTQHILIESLKFGTAQKMLIGDPTIDILVLDIVKSIMDKTNAKNNADKVNFDKTFPPKYYEQKYSDIKESGTCHISTILNLENGSSEGVAYTTSINNVFGSKLLDPFSGVILNDQMNDFSIPGMKDSLGNSPNPINFPYKNRKPRSTMIPTIIREIGTNRVISIGASGGPRILGSVFQSLVAILDWGYSSYLAVEMPRFAHLLTPNIIELELEWKSYNEKIINELIQKEHEVKWLGKLPVASLVKIIIKGASSSKIRKWHFGKIFRFSSNKDRCWLLNK